MSYADGKTLSLQYDNRMRATQWHVPGVMQWDYSYTNFGENTGRVTYAKNVDDGTLDRSYDYGQVGRLVAAHSGQEARWHIGTATWAIDGPYSQLYGYDQFGNRTHREGWGGSYGSSNIIENPTYSNNRQTGLTYDAAGNLTNDGSQNYNYDATGQQTTASGAGLSQSYDGDRLRAKKIENGVATYYIRSSVLGGQVVAEINSGGSWTRGFVYLGGQMVALQGGTGGAVSWVHQDPVTKSQRVTNGSGTIISTVDLDPWGGETGRSLTSAFQPHRYTSYERDANGGDDAMMRRYQSTASQFSQPDPYDGSYSLTNPQSFNRYVYVDNDPVNSVDPSGLMADAVCSAEFGLNACGGAGGWSGGYAGGTGWGSDPRPGMSTIGERASQRDALVQARIDGGRAQHYLDNGNFGAAQRIFDDNPGVGLYQDGTPLWGEFASAFTSGYSTARQQFLLAAGGAHGDVWRVTDLALRAMVSLGWKAVVNKISQIRGPDFQLVNINAVAGITRFVARGDGLSSALQGVSAGPGAQISYAVGWMLQGTTPSREQIRDWGSGLSVSADFFFIGGGGIVRSMSSSTRGVYAGFGAGGGWGSSFQYPVP